MQKKRELVQSKLVTSFKLSQLESDQIFDRVKIVSLSEDNIYKDVMTRLSQTIVGIDSEKAFDLFTKWIFDLSENREKVTRKQIVSRMNEIGSALTDRANLLMEWNTSIKPIESNTSVNQERLQKEFYAGVSTRYEHVEADLDFHRTEKLIKLESLFQENNIVIIHGASGQGKTTLAYRYLHDNFPSSWRYQIELIESKSHALQISSAISGQASALNAPIIIYLDVRPNDQNWTELASQLAQQPMIRILVTIREEDFRKANIGSHLFKFGRLPLRFNKDEARNIYNRAIKLESQIKGHFLTFETSWEAFREQGPLLEYVYLLTQTTTLQDRLSEQLQNLAESADTSSTDDKWNLLGWVAIVSAYEARLKYDELKKLVERPSLLGFHLNQLEEEYLIRVSNDGLVIEGLHSIRSVILVELMEKFNPTFWFEGLDQIIQAIVDEDIQSFLLNSFVDRPEKDQASLIQKLIAFHPMSWVGNVGICRALLWIGLKEYIETNKNVIQDAEYKSKGSWSQIFLDMDFVGMMADDPFPADKFIFRNRSSDFRQEIESYRDSQTPKIEAFKYVANWLNTFVDTPNPPNTQLNWIGFARSSRFVWIFTNREPDI